MERYDMELHTLACEIADMDGLTYDEALARAHRELGAAEQYAHEWDQGAAYLEVLGTLERGGAPTTAQLDTRMRAER